MKLFKFEDYKLIISEEALLIEAFRRIWNRDRTKHKEKALQELGYIYFFCDPRSDYMFLIDEATRAKQIIEQEGLDNSWKPDELVLRGMEVYKTLIVTTSSLLLEDTRYAIEKVRTFLREVDLTEEDDKGKPKYTPQSITATIKSIPDLIENLVKVERIVTKDIEDASRMRGTGEKKLLEDGFVL